MKHLGRSMLGLFLLGSSLSVQASHRYCTVYSGPVTDTYSRDRTSNFDVRLRPKTRDGELATFDFSGISHEELYNAYLYGQIGQVIDLASVNSRLDFKNGYVEKTVEALTPMGLEAQMVIREKSNSPELKVVETDIRIQVADPAAIGLPGGMGMIGHLIYKMSGSERFLISGRVRQTFYSEGGNGVMTEDWLVPLSLRVVLPGGLEVPVPAVGALLQKTADAALPIFDRRGIRNFARFIRMEQRLAPEMINLSETVEPSPATGPGGFLVTSEHFIPGYSIEEFQVVAHKIGLIGRYGFAADDMVKVDSKSIVTQRSIHDVSVRVPGVDMWMPGLSITLEIDTHHASDRAVRIVNTDSGVISGRGEIIVSEGRVGGKFGLLVRESGEYRPDLRMVSGALAILNPTGLSSPAPYIFGYVHALAYRPTVVGIVLKDSFGRRQSGP